MTNKGYDSEEVHKLIKKGVKGQGSDTCKSRYAQEGYEEISDKGQDRSKTKHVLVKCTIV